MTQKNYFQGSYIGCDINSGLGFPDWFGLGNAYNLEVYELSENWWKKETFLDLWNSQSPVIFLVPIHPAQTYFPKISSRISASGGMESNPLHKMSPDLEPELERKVTKFLQKTKIN